jgi:hypothetical protein
MLLFSK